MRKPSKPESIARLLQECSKDPVLLAKHKLYLFSVARWNMNANAKEIGLFLTEKDHKFFARGGFVAVAVRVDCYEPLAPPIPFPLALAHREDG